MQKTTTIKICITAILAMSLMIPTQATGGDILIYTFENGEKYMFDNYKNQGDVTKYHNNATGTRDDVIKIARTQLGYAGRIAKGKRLSYFALGDWNDGVRKLNTGDKINSAWCSEFAYWVLYQAKVQGIDKNSELINVNKFRDKYKQSMYQLDTAKTSEYKNIVDNWFKDAGFEVGSNRIKKIKAQELLPGDILQVYTRENQDNPHHTAIFTKIDSNGKICTLEGNVEKSKVELPNGNLSNATHVVERCKYTQKNIIAVLRPPYKAAQTHKELINDTTNKYWYSGYLNFNNLKNYSNNATGKRSDVINIARTQIGYNGTVATINGVKKYVSIFNFGNWNTKLANYNNNTESGDWCSEFIYWVLYYANVSGVDKDNIITSQYNFRDKYKNSMFPMYASNGNSASYKEKYKQTVDNWFKSAGLIAPKNLTGLKLAELKQGDILQICTDARIMSNKKHEPHRTGIFTKINPQNKNKVCVIEGSANNSVKEICTYDARNIIAVLRPPYKE